MEDLQCADLERLATAASTMVYSSNNLDLSTTHLESTVADRPSNFTIHTTDSANEVVQYSANPYDLSRNQTLSDPNYTIRVAEYHNMEHGEHNPTEPHHNVHSSQQNAHFTVVERPHSIIYAPIRTNTHYIPTSITMHSSSAHDGIEEEVKNCNVAHNSFTLSSNETLISVPSTTESPIQVSEVSLQPQVLHVQYLEDRLFIENHSNTNTSIDNTIQEETHRKNNNKRIKVEEVKNSKVPKKKSSPLKAEAGSSEVKTHKNALLEVPEPVEIDGVKAYVCLLCEKRFARKYMFTRHQKTHTGEKRGALSLETKVDIIKRIKQGEKLVDLAMEYNIGRSTLSVIMKNADKLLSVLEKGKFDPSSKRLRGAQKEDLEEVLVEWLKQADALNLPISGPILCKKAKDFALKLGYKDFKGTHGWLDRFKHRKKIVLGRSKNTQEKEALDEYEDLNSDFNEVIHQLVHEYESESIFYAEEIALLYKVFPNECLTFKGMKCCGGRYSKKRLTFLICTNMTGSEKFPLYVVGRNNKPKCFKNVKSLPVQYSSNEKSWMTQESFLTWLNDLDSWFTQQQRKILLFISSLPIHPKQYKLQSVKVVVCPSNVIGPCKIGISNALKRNYRRSVLETLLHLIESEPMKHKRKVKMMKSFNLLNCLHLLAAAWHAVTEATINNSFQKAGFSKFSMWSVNLVNENNIGNENLNLLHNLRLNGYKFSNSLTFDDFVVFDDDLQVCHMMDDEDIIAVVTKGSAESSDSEEDQDNSNEYEATSKLQHGNLDGVNNDENSHDSSSSIEPTLTDVKKSFSILNDFVHLKEGNSEMFKTLNHLEQLLYKNSLASEETLKRVKKN